MPRYNDEEFIQHADDQINDGTVSGNHPLAECDESFSNVPAEPHESPRTPIGDAIESYQGFATLEILYETISVDTEGTPADTDLTGSGLIVYAGETECEKQKIIVLHSIPDIAFYHFVFRLRSKTGSTTYSDIHQYIYCVNHNTCGSEGEETDERCAPRPAGIPGTPGGPPPSPPPAETVPDQPDPVPTTRICRSLDSDIVIIGSRIEYQNSTTEYDPGSPTSVRVESSTILDTRFGFFISPAGIPYRSQWPTGDWKFAAEWGEVTGNWSARCRIHRIGSLGNVLESSPFSSTQDIIDSGSAEFSFSGLSWSPGTIYDRYAVELTYIKKSSGTTHADIVVDDQSAGSTIRSPF